MYENVLMKLTTLYANVKIHLKAIFILKNRKIKHLEAK